MVGTGLMEHLPRLPGQEGGRVADGAVEAGGSLAASEDEDGQALRVETVGLA